MILCVNLNAAIDKTALVSPFELNQIHRPQSVLALPGGKGCNVARALKTLGETPVVTGWIGGFAGAFIEAALRREGIESAFVETESESRTCLSILDEANGTLTELYENGAPVSPDKLDELLARFELIIGEFSAVALCGSIPKGVPADTYARLIAIAHREGIPVALDASGEALKLGLAARPLLIKPNKAEFADLIGAMPDTLPGFAAAAADVARRFDVIVVLSLGADGALGVQDGEIWHARPPQLKIRSAVGSGDSLVAGVVRGLTRGLPLADALATGVAAGTANALHIGAGVFTLEDFEQVRAQVTVERYA